MTRCEVEGCTVKSACFNFIHEKDGRRCAGHKLEGMVDVKNPKCDFVAEDGTKCRGRRRFGFEGKSPNRCSEHREEGMMELTRKKCDYVDPETKVKCKITAGYGPEGGKKTRCSTHRLPDMIDLASKLCNFVDPVTGKKCTVGAGYGYPGEVRVKCVSHKLKDMVNVISKSCELCGKQPSLGFVQGEPKRCKEHATEGMINVIDPKCIFVDENGKKCTTIASFNFPGERRPSHCGKHKAENMEDVVSPTCSYPGCEIRPSYNFPGLPRKTCKQHAEKGMVHVYDKLCEAEGCKLRACYNYENETEGIRCSEHSLPEMVDITKRKCEDCKSIAYYNYIEEKFPRKCREHKLDKMIKTCERNSRKCENCDDVAWYGLLFGEKRHCAAHKLPHEFRRNNPICQVEDCKEKACCTNNGLNYPDRCSFHALPNDINLVEKECKKCGLQYLLNEETGLCDICNADRVSDFRKLKEKETISFLENNGINFLTIDKIPENAASRFRPDAVVHFEHFIVIIEIDEDQHKGYEQSCEKTRMMQLHQEYKGLPVVFIRFNPDNYKIRLDNGEKKVMRPGAHRLTQLLDLVRRFQVLRNSYSTQTPLPPLSVCYLFYDGYNGNPKLETIDIFAEVRAQTKPPVKPILKIIKQ